MDHAPYVRQLERDGNQISHSDRGYPQYVNIRYTEDLSEAGIEPSEGIKGGRHDNALARRSTGCTRQN